MGILIKNRFHFVTVLGVLSTFCVTLYFLNSFHIQNHSMILQDFLYKRILNIHTTHTNIR